MTTSALSLSVLDLIPVRTAQSSAQAIAASVALAQSADRLGYTRYWVAEHHNMQAVASTNPPVLIGILAARTERIRVGSGGVMLPNHSPLVIAEQFGLLEAAFPGRIDLGLGRAPGSDPMITALLRSSGAVSEVDAFPRNIDDIAALLQPGGAALSLTSGQEYALRATPAADAMPEVWLLGSSDYSARLAAKQGMPYVFANHFAGDGTTQALDLYRRGFTPSDTLAAPRTILTLNVVVADTAAEARALALPQMQQMARLRSGQPLGPLATLEEAAATTMAPAQQGMIERMSATWILDEPVAAAARIRDLAARFGVDEVMLQPIASAHGTAAPATSPARERTLELLAAELLEAAPAPVTGP
ncbi:LLM class flavin-dependent oxidoreductase [Cryobacterium sp. TmT2-59]|uniref:LLM class flavin-dependent oxidoreductase n=1 Tax=Cryobacterium sp. TmT2-59 TaxID=1259264 RepID=UPI00106AC6F4|nr:LLM class flavin-dependent oxidoreductase [Cryobacterium sp. TmT2-59]TFC83737.1 LLM class flavin-dependent oxidoreductase [Cryobacterium sp. TmT2-59]